MSTEIVQEWLVVLSFFLTVAGCIVGEAVWLNKKGWAGFGKSLAFSFLTDFISYSIGFFVVFVVLGIILMNTLGGSQDKLLPIGGIGEGVMIIFAALFTPAFLTICKRLFLSILKMQSGKAAWLYSIAGSVLTLALSLVIPILLGYLMFR